MPTALRKRYTVSETLYEGRDTTLYRGSRIADGRPVLIKTLRPKASERSLRRLQNEFDVGRALDSPLVVKAVALETYRDGAALILEDSGGRSLRTMNSSLRWTR